MTVDRFHAFPDIMKKSAEKQYASDYDANLVVEEFLDMQVETLFATRVRTLLFHWLRGDDIEENCSTTTPCSSHL